MDVFEAEGDAGGKNQNQDEPFEGRRVDDRKNRFSNKRPFSTYSGLKTSIPADASVVEISE